jgi:hypothetical protein
MSIRLFTKVLRLFCDALAAMPLERSMRLQTVE